MEFRFGVQEEQFRTEVRAFLKEHLPPDTKEGIRLGASPEAHKQAIAFNKQLAAKGWIAPAWPVEYGGMGAGVYQQMVFNEELGYSGAPDGGLRLYGVSMIGPTLIVHGSEEQKHHYLPKITSLEHVWCQGYSEPGAGSDLAALTTRAVRDGDDYVINGQKIWTSDAQDANQMFCLVRTDPEAPKHRGISFLLIDDIHNVPGLTVRPLINMANTHHFNEVFFEDVRVPVKNRVGEENAGWYVGMTLLDFERSGVGATAGQRKTLERLAVWLRTAPADIRAAHRAKLADHVVANEVARYLGYRIGYLQAQGSVISQEASLVKLLTSELTQKIYNFGVNLLGLNGQLRAEDARAPLAGDMPDGYMDAVPITIYSGSSEVQRNIIATRGLGLPR